MKRTTNYDLPTWEKDDFIRMQDFNDLTGKLDAALKQTADTADEVSQTAATAESVTAIAQDLGTHGKNCRVAWGTYIGTGLTGSANANSLQTGFYPVLVMVGSNENCTSDNSPVMFLRARTGARNEVTVSDMVVTWTDSGLSWYSGSHADNQLNAANRVFYYVAIGYDL